MTKTTTVPHLLEQLSVELHANGVKFDTAIGYGVRVRLRVKFEPVSDRYDQACVLVDAVRMDEYRVLCGEESSVQMDNGTDITHLIPKSQVAAIEENLLAQMGGDV